jgi:predicted nucleic acid-binding protein
LVRGGGTSAVEGTASVKSPPAEVVIDASCAIKWFTEEADTDLSLRLRDAYYQSKVELYAPDLMAYEVANALRFKPRTPPKLLEEWIVDLFRMQIVLLPPTEDLLRQAAALSQKWETSVYDAVYLALAESLGLQLVTADARFFDKVQHSGRVLLLSTLEF